MTDDRLALLEALQKADDGNFLRSLAETVLQAGAYRVPSPIGAPAPTWPGASGASSSPQE